MVVLLVLLFIGIILLEAPGLIKKKMWRELVAFSVYLSIGMVLSIPQVLGLKLPNAGNLIIKGLLKPLAEFLKP